MPSLFRSLTILIGSVLIVSLASCSNTPAPPAQSYMSEFTDVVAKLKQVAQEQSVNGTTITIGSSAEEPDGKRVMTARRVTTQSTTEYTFHFHKPNARWVCARADAQETENSGGKSQFNIEGTSIEIEQLIAWLKW